MTSSSRLGGFSGTIRDNGGQNFQFNNLLEGARKVRKGIVPSHFLYFWRDGAGTNADAVDLDRSQPLPQHCSVL